jgi:hypothetical protein
MELRALEPVDKEPRIQPVGRLKDYRRIWIETDKSYKAESALPQNIQYA